MRYFSARCPCDLHGGVNSQRGPLGDNGAGMIIAGRMILNKISHTFDAKIGISSMTALRLVIITDRRWFSYKSPESFLQ